MLYYKVLTLIICPSRTLRSANEYPFSLKVVSVDLPQEEGKLTLPGVLLGGSFLRGLNHLEMLEEMILYCFKFYRRDKRSFSGKTRTSLPLWATTRAMKESWRGKVKGS